MFVDAFGIQLAHLISYDTTDTNFDTISPMVYVELCRVM